MVSDSEYINSLDPELDRWYEEEIEHRADQLDLSVEISDSYQNLNDLNLLLGGLDSSLSESLSPFKEQLLAHFEAPWAKEIIKLYGSKDVIDSNTIRLALESTSLQPSQIEIAARHFEKTHNALGTKSLNVLKSRFQKILNTMKMNWAVNSFSDPEKIIENLSKKGAIVLGDGLDEFRDIIKEDSIFNVDTDEIKNIASSGIKSSIDWINNNFSCGGFPPSSFILVSAPPSCGKSLFATSQAIQSLKDGYDVVYTCIGDLGPTDFIVRMIGIYYDVSMNRVVENIELYLARFKHDFAEENKRFHPLFIDPNKITISQLKTYYTKKGYLNKNTVCIIDYDENLAPEKGSGGKEDMMYEKFKQIYQVGISLTRGENSFALCFILGQPKTEYFTSPNIPLVGASMGSTSKVHNVDICITLGRDSCQNHQGYLSLCKVRRFGRANSCPYTLTASGRFQPIPLDTYNSLKEQSTYATMNKEEDNHRRIMEETQRLILTNFKEQSDLEI